MPVAIINGIELYYEHCGSGPPVLMVMGLGAPLEGWTPQLSVLSQQHQVCVFDNRGIGRSAAPPAPYSMDTLAADALGLMDRMGWPRAHIVGLSMGGMIAQRMALTAPERVCSLTLMATHAGGRQALPTQTAVRGILRTRFFGDREARERNLVRMLHAQAYIDSVGMETILHNIRTRMLQHPRPLGGFIGQLSATLRHNTLQELPSLRGQFPALVIVGGADRMVRPANSKPLAEALGAELLWFEGGGHAIHVEEHAAINAALQQLFGRVT